MFIACVFLYPARHIGKNPQGRLSNTSHYCKYNHVQPWPAACLRHNDDKLYPDFLWVKLCSQQPSLIELTTIGEIGDTLIAGLMHWPQTMIDGLLWLSAVCSCGWSRWTHAVTNRPPHSRDDAMCLHHNSSLAMVQFTYTSGFSIFKLALNVVQNVKAILGI